jgi:hypothetical protein
MIGLCIPCEFWNLCDFLSSGLHFGLVQITRINAHSINKQSATKAPELVVGNVCFQVRCHHTVVLHFSICIDADGVVYLFHGSDSLTVDGHDGLDLHHEDILTRALAKLSSSAFLLGLLAGDFFAILEVVDLVDRVGVVHRGATEVEVALVLNHIGEEHPLAPWERLGSGRGQTHFPLGLDVGDVVVVHTDSALELGLLGDRRVALVHFAVTHSRQGDDLTLELEQLLHASGQR